MQLIGGLVLLIVIPKMRTFFVRKCGATPLDYDKAKNP